MAIMIHVNLRKVPIDVFDEVNQELGAIENPPAGLVVHFAHPVGEDGVRIVDVWMSEDDHDAFDAANDPPAVMARLLRQRGLDPPEFVSRDVIEIRGLVTGSTA
jgi:hypothetical protein